MDPSTIKEIIETDTVKTAVMTREAAIDMKERFEGQGETIHIEGMEMQLLNFHKLKKKDGSFKGVLYVKINTDLGQIIYATSDDKDADQVLKDIMPALENMSNKTGLQLVNIRTVATESLGSLKREKGVTTTPELMKIMEQEQEPDGDTQ
jgi:hypothetical protein